MLNGRWPHGLSTWNWVRDAIIIKDGRLYDTMLTNQEKALVGAFSVITNLRMELFQALLFSPTWARLGAVMGIPWLLLISIGRLDIICIVTASQFLLSTVWYVHCSHLFSYLLYSYKRCSCLALTQHQANTQPTGNNKYYEFSSLIPALIRGRLNCSYHRPR